MDAKSVLEKFGWKEGQGLGKNNDGMSKPVKVFMKRDNGGSIIRITSNLYINRNKERCGSCIPL